MSQWNPSAQEPSTVHDVAQLPPVHANAPHEPLSQQTPSTQLPLPHWAALPEHASPPAAFCTQRLVPMLQ